MPFSGLSGQAIRILFVEDLPSDAELAARGLRKSGLTFTWDRVDTAQGLRDALAARRPDLIISDYSLPGFTGLEALAITLAHDDKLPFIIVSGSLTDEAAVACLKAGAWDYVSKEHPTRLPFAVREALARRRADTDAAEARAALVHAQKMEAVGRLAGGVSHDFNNMLTGILGYCDLLLASMPGTSPHRADILKIQSVAHRASALTRQLLAFSRKEAMTPVPVNLTTLASDWKKPLRTMLRKNIEIHWELAAGLDDINGDPAQIEQAVYNLATNAADAMPTGGHLTIRTFAVMLDPDFIAHHAGSHPGPHVALSVSDTGEGIEPDHLPLVFEPFFTTKEAGEGTGLGLAAVYGIVKQSGGYIEARSERRVGSTFTMYFPTVASGASVDPPPAPGPLPEDGHGTEAVLLVEDDEHLRSVLHRVLEGHGYEVLDAVDGVDATTRFLGETARIDLVLTDVVMPRTNGVEMARRFRAVRPDLPVVFMSAYTDPATFSGMVTDARTVFIKKPYLPSVLVRQIRQLLDHCRTRS